MSASRQARRERREAERKTKKAEFKRLKAAGLSAPVPELEEEFSPEFIAHANSVRERIHRRAGLELEETPELSRSCQRAEPGFVSQTAAEPSKRAEINRRNALHSTGPRSWAGKLAPSRNSLKHGLASGEIIIPGEDVGAFEALHNALLDEHQPANETEALLIKEMAQSCWLTERAIRLQNDCFSENGVEDKRTGRSGPVVRVNEARLSLFLRYQTTHDRAFYKALNTLRLLQKERRKAEHGFVSQKATAPTLGDGFVSQKPRAERVDHALRASEEDLVPVPSPSLTAKAA